MPASKTPTLSPAECADELERMAVAANVISWPKATQDACTAAAHHLRAQAAEIERMRGALSDMIVGVEEWCAAVDKDASWDGWDAHYKYFADGWRGSVSGLDAARAALAPTQETT